MPKPVQLFSVSKQYPFLDDNELLASEKQFVHIPADIADHDVIDDNDMWIQADARLDTWCKRKGQSLRVHS